MKCLKFILNVFKHIPWHLSTRGRLFLLQDVSALCVLTWLDNACFLLHTNEQNLHDNTILAKMNDRFAAKNV